jgi:hypothetical protein
LVSDGTNFKTYAVDTVLVAGSTVQLTLNGSIPKGALVSLRYADPTTGNDLLAIQDLGSTNNGTDAVSILPLNGSNHVNFNVGNGTDGLGGGGGGAWGAAGANIGGKGGSGVVMASYDTGVSESDLLSFLQSIENTDTSGSVNTLTQSNLATYLNALETASRAIDWEWTTAKISAVL